MKNLLLSIATAFNGEFLDHKNILGWTMASTAWFLANVEQINTILGAILSTVSILWVCLKIALAIHGHFKRRSVK